MPFENDILAPLRAGRLVTRVAPVAKAIQREEPCQHAMELHGGNGVMLDFGVEKLLRDASLFLHRDATVDISRFKTVKAMFPETAGRYAGPES